MDRVRTALGIDQAAVLAATGSGAGWDRRRMDPSVEIPDVDALSRKLRFHALGPLAKTPFERKVAA